MADKKLKIKEIKKLNKPHKNEKNIPNTNDYIIEFNNVSKSYTTGGDIFEALKNINLKIKKGTFNIILGKSGSGKSTLMNIMSGLIRATEGQTIVNNNDLINFKNSELTKFRAKTCGFIFQQYGLLSTLTVEENIFTGLNLKNMVITNKKEEHKKKDKDDSEKKELYNNDYMYQIMKIIGIYDLRKKFPSQLSGGQQQRVSIARAIIKEPTILFGDEPTGAVDSAMTYSIIELLKKINKENKTTVVLITHDPRLAKVADHVIEIINGEIVKDYEQEPLENFKELFI